MSKYTCTANVIVKGLRVFLRAVISLQLLIKSSGIRKTLQLSVFSLCIRGDQSSAFEGSANTMAETLKHEHMPHQRGRDVSTDAGFLMNLLHHFMANVSYDEQWGFHIPPDVSSKSVIMQTTESLYVVEQLSYRAYKTKVYNKV